MGSIIGQKNRLKWGGGSERPAAHTQQTLTQVSPGPQPIHKFHLLKEMRDTFIIFVLGVGDWDTNFITHIPDEVLQLEQGSNDHHDVCVWYNHAQVDLQQPNGTTLARQIP